MSIVVMSYAPHDSPKERAVRSMCGRGKGWNLVVFLHVCGPFGCNRVSFRICRVFYCISRFPFRCLCFYNGAQCQAFASTLDEAMCVYGSTLSCNTYWHVIWYPSELS